MHFYKLTHSSINQKGLLQKDFLLWCHPNIPYNNLNIRKKIYLSKFRARALSNLPIQ